MNKNTILKVIVSVLLLIGLVILPFYINSYEKFSMEGESCQLYYASCICYGSYYVGDSYPPSHVCGGIERCSSINRTVCR
ncbi:MAG: hypothetical protein ACLFPL_01180 [Candidatus Nanoarchaeia archaeon]